MEPQRPKLYFAHPIGTYHTPIERKALFYLRKLFPHHDIVNPADREHAYAGRGDPQYFQKLASDADCVIYLPFGDGRIGADIAKEIAAMHKKGGKVHELHVSSDGMPLAMFGEVEALGRDRALSWAETQLHNKAAKRRRSLSAHSPG